MPRLKAETVAGEVFEYDSMVEDDLGQNVTFTRSPVGIVRVLPKANIVSFDVDGTLPLP